MKTLGIIAEYNPFHKGHFYHLTESKKISGASACIAVMSGNFVQRGDAALLSKWERAKIAVDCGVDLVLELPFVYACNSAEIFAKGAVQILNSLCCVSCISFGSESGDLRKLSETASVVASESGEFKKNLKEELGRGGSYPRARAFAVRLAAGGEAAEILDGPNNVLAVEYIKQLALTGSKLMPITVKRKGQGYNEAVPDGDFSSAAAIRGALQNCEDVDCISEYVPDECFCRMKKGGIDVNGNNSRLFLLILAKIISEHEERLEGTISAGEGLGNKLKKAAGASWDMESLISGVKSKRYTRTRVQRLLIHTLMNLSKADFLDIESCGLNFARVLAFNSKGAFLLKTIKEAGPAIPVITNINKQTKRHEDIWKLLRYDVLASDMYNLISGRSIHANSDFVVAPYYKF